MLRIARSSERARRAGATDEALGPAVIDPKKVAAGQHRTDMLNMVQAYGCHVCCGFVHLNPDGSRLGCALLAANEEGTHTYDPGLNLDAREKKLAKNCTIPDLYEEVFDWKRTALKEEEVLARVPDFREEEQKEGEAEMKMTGKAAKEEAKKEGAILTEAGLINARPTDERPAGTAPHDPEKG